MAGSTVTPGFPCVMSLTVTPSRTGIMVRVEWIDAAGGPRGGQGAQYSSGSLSGLGLVGFGPPDAPHWTE